MTMYLWIFLSVAMISLLLIVIVGIIKSGSKGHHSRRQSNKLMIARVALQALAIFVLFIIWFLRKV